MQPGFLFAIRYSPFATAMLGVLLAVGLPASAQDYPARPIELVVPFPPGGGADVSARMVAQIAGESLGQPIVIQNKAGATGAIGSEYVARAAADGYTLLLATGSTHAVLPAYRADLPYDTVTSFAPATLLAIIPNMLVVNPTKVPVATIAELIAYLKQHPGKVDLIFDNMPVVWPQVQQGRLRALGVASLERTPLAPDLPAIAEALPGYEAVSWVGIVAPAGTPPAIVDRISQAFGAAA